MEKSLSGSCAFAIIAASFACTARAESPGLVNFGKLTPPRKGYEFVEVNIHSNLLNFAGLLVEKEEPDAATFLCGVKLVRGKLLGLTEENRSEMEKRVQRLRQDLKEQSREGIGNMPGNEGDDVGVNTQIQWGEVLAGIGPTVIDPERVAQVNVVSEVPPEKLLALSEWLDVKPLKELAGAPSNVNRGKIAGSSDVSRAARFTRYQNPIAA